MNIYKGLEERVCFHNVVSWLASMLPFHVKGNGSIPYLRPAGAPLGLCWQPSRWGLVNRIRPSVQTSRFRVFVTGTSATRGVLQFLLYQDIAQMCHLKMVVYKQPGCEQLWFLSPRNSEWWFMTCASLHWPSMWCEMYCKSDIKRLKRKKDFFFPKVSIFKVSIS